MATDNSDLTVRGDELGEGGAELREPIVVSPDELSRAIMAGENIWRRPASPVDISVQWGASNCPSKATPALLEKIRGVFRVPDSVQLIVPRSDERACYPRPGCVAVSDHLFRGGLRLPLHPFFRLVLRTYGLAPTQLHPNSWSQLVGSWMLWRRVSLGVDMPFSVFHSLYLPKTITGEGSKGWYYLSPWGSHSPFVTELPSSIKGWKYSWFWAAGRWDTMENDPMAPLTVPTTYSTPNSVPRCEISEEDWDLIGEIYQLDPKERGHEKLINQHISFVRNELMSNLGDFNKKKPLRPDFATIRRSVAEAKLLQTGTAAYKKQTERLLSLSKAAAVAEEVPAEEGTSLVRKRKIPGGTSAAATSTPSPVISPTASAEVTVAIPADARAVVPISSFPAGGVTKKRLKRPAGTPAKSKAPDFIGSKDDELPEAVLEMLPPETASAARVHNKFWTEAWQDHTASCEVEDLLAANNACIARALTLSTAAEDLVRGLRKKNDDLETRLEASAKWEEELVAARRRADEEEERRMEAVVKLDSAEIQVNRLRNELHESVSQVAALTKRIDQSNEHQRIASEALELANKEKVELNLLVKAQAEEVESLKAEVSSVGEAAVQKYKDNFDSTPEYDDFANYWASWSAQEIISRLREKHPELDISSIVNEFGGPTGGRPDVGEGVE